MWLTLPPLTATRLLALSRDPACEIGQQIDVTAGSTLGIFLVPSTVPGGRASVGHWFDVQFSDQKAQHALQEHFMGAGYREDRFYGSCTSLHALLNEVLAGMVVFGHIEMEIRWQEMTSQGMTLLLPVFVRILDPSRTATLSIGRHTWALTGSSLLGVGSGFGLRVGNLQYGREHHLTRGKWMRPTNTVQFRLPFYMSQYAVWKTALRLRGYHRYMMQMSRAGAYPMDHSLPLELARIYDFEKEKRRAAYSLYQMSVLFKGFPDRWLTMSSDTTEYYDAWMRRRLALTQILLRKTIVSQFNDQVFGMVASKNSLSSVPQFVFTRDVSESAVEDLWQKYSSEAIDSSTFQQELFDLTR